jgi:hypothetical protein
MGFRGSQSSTATSGRAGFSNTTAVTYTPAGTDLHSYPNTAAVKIDDAEIRGDVGSGRQVVRQQEHVLCNQRWK